MMQLRPYNKQTDFTYIANWIQDERAHALWCAHLLSHPLSEGELRQYLQEHGDDRGYVYVDDGDRPIGFFIFSVNEKDKSGFLKFIIVDNVLRGKGYGTAMLRELQQFAYEKTGVNSLRLIVFDVNTAARTCYEKAGFTVIENLPDTFSYKDEMWGRVLMEHTK